MSSETDIGVDPRLERFECRASSDEVKRDLELICLDCEGHICDVEHGDGLGVLARTALDHADGCEGDAPTKELRADRLEVNMSFREIGDCDWHRIYKVKMHGDGVLIITFDEIELSLDGDEVVEVKA